MRRSININPGWSFTGPDGAVQSVNIPHTWNNIDGQDGGNDYKRCACTYEKKLAPPEFDPASERVYLQFEGVNSECEVSLNGKPVCSHEGGYSTFRADITDFLEADNLLSVKADNSPNDRVYPQKADFTFYGGIYRDVTLLIVNRNHFDLDYFGAPGVQVTAKPVEGYAKGIVEVKSYVTGEGDVKVRLLDASGACVAEGEGTDCEILIDKVHLWNGTDDPYLYTCVSTLMNDGKAVDEVRVRFGVRDFHYHPSTGFYLNGRSYPLRGVSRHQDRKGLGNAITKAMHKEDMDIICEMGTNTIRLAHYQHDQYFYDLCDERGMVVWAEIPYISEHMPNGRANTISQMTELIAQNYNHPSIVCWGVSNEITISTKDKADMLDNHKVLNDLCHKMDPTRFTTLACYAMCGPFNKSAHITDVVSWNLYLGWYVPGLWLNDVWMRFFHLVYPKRCLGYSEYGCEGMPNLHSSHPRRGDHTEEYQAKYHEYMLECFERNPYMWATHVWNMFDFAADARNQGGEPGMNHKGLVTFDRKTRKDSFYLYKAYWSKDPFVHICSKRFEDRTEDKITVRVYSNQNEVSLFVNGDKLETQYGSHVYTFTVPMSATVTVRAASGECSDQAVFHKVSTPNPSYTLKDTGDKGANWAEKKED
ncbi:MAG: glycoside hydrolase family 2 protein [Lachnospiraceae bacterium]|nr:glycoside hydrolase family 2 protein [Lachnospiraceae bacterium]